MRPLLALLLTACASAPRYGESLWYLRGEESVRSFLAHSERISVIAPQVFQMDSNGVIRGGVDERVVAAAREKGVKLVPLVMNPGFDQPSIHRVLNHPEARSRAVRSLAELCRTHHFDGIQFDFENFHVSDRDAFTSFTREAVDSVHRAGCQLSAAVVPRTGDDPGTNSYDRWIHDNWRAGFDYKALADTLDYISYMTYAQHTGGSPPGPVAGFPWVKASLDYLLALGVPPAKISLGIASYSDWWFPVFSDARGAHLTGRDISHAHAMAILDSAAVRPRWDAVQKAWVASWESHGVFRHAWIEDQRAFFAKLALVPQHGLRGYSVWLIGTEDPAIWKRLPPTKRR